MTQRRFVAVSAGLVALLSAEIAAACPTCASREEPGSLRWFAIGALMLSPWIVAGSIALYIKRGMRREAQGNQLSMENLP
jgi:hypothetical protein